VGRLESLSGRRLGCLAPLRGCALAASLMACAACRAACPPGERCGTATWVLGPNDPVVEGDFRAFRAITAGDPALGPGADPEALSLRTRALVVRFDLSELARRSLSVERATLLLSPHPRWATRDGSVRLAVHPVLALGASANGEEPTTTEDPCAVATIPLSMRGPIRVDVTAAARLWANGSVMLGALALSADAEGLVVQGAAAIDGDGRPRLEVVFR
jgi:hypothetical protein